MEIKQAWYRVSIKALILNENWDFLLAKENNWVWDFPWGWLDHWEEIEDCLKRELKEEMGLKILFIGNSPSCFVAVAKPESKTRPFIANIFYKVDVENLNFKVSDECIEIWFFNKDTIKNIKVLPNVTEFFKNN